MLQIQTFISLALALLTIDPSLEVRDVDGRPFRPFRVQGTAQVLFFLSAECPISRFYAQEIQRICKDYGARGVGCALVYEDLPVDAAAVRAHVREFGYSGFPVMTDPTREIAAKARASVTPQAVVMPRVCDRGRVVQWTVFIVIMVAISGVVSLLGSLIVLALNLEPRVPFASILAVSFKACAVISVVIGVNQAAFDRLKGQLEDTKQESVHQESVCHGTIRSCVRHVATFCSDGCSTVT